MNKVTLELTDAECLERLARVQRVCQESAGGLLKRIDENRAFNDLMHNEVFKVPELFTKCSFFRSWLISHDDYLTILAKNLGITGQDDYPRPWFFYDDADASKFCRNWNTLLKPASKKQPPANLAKILKVMRRGWPLNRGILKRIDENRGFILVLQYNCQDVAKRWPCIELWVEQMDIFLVDLLGAIGLEVILKDMGEKGLAIKNNNYPFRSYGSYPRPWKGREINHLRMQF